MHDIDKADRPATLGAFGYFAAIVLCCIIVGGLTYGFGREDERRSNTPARYAKAAKTDVASACVNTDGPPAFECVYEKVKATQEQARGEQDLSAQLRSANAAMISALIAFATLVLSAIGVWYVKRTLDATLKAVKDTSIATSAMVKQNDLAEAAQRPWVSIDCEVVELERDGGLMKVVYVLSFINQGKMAARSFDIRTRCKFALEDQANATAESFFGYFQHRRKISKHVLLPGETQKFEGMIHQRIDMMTNDLDVVPGHYYCLISGVAQYQSSDDQVWHDTERCFCVGMKSDDVFFQRMLKGDLTDGIYTEQVSTRRFRSGMTT